MEKFVQEMVNGVLIKKRDTKRMKNTRGGHPHFIAGWRG
jgi:hypothetical protein